MKKITTLFMMLLAAVMTLSMSSCTEDQLIGMDLEGTWEGRMYIAHEYEGRTYQSTSSILTFSADLFKVKSGSGYWVDYYDSYGWGRNYIANHISWRVQGGVIYIHFREDNYDIEIHDYRLNSGRFVGTIYTYDGKIVDFDLYKTRDPNWESDYIYGYGYLYSRETRAGGNNNAVELPKRKVIPETVK